MNGDVTLKDAAHASCPHWCGSPTCARACGSEKCATCFPTGEYADEGWHLLWSNYREARRRGPS